MSCDAATWRCVTTFDRSRSSRWVSGGSNRLRLLNTNLCLNVWGGTNQANLFHCDPVSKNAQWTSWGTQVGAWVLWLALGLGSPARSAVSVLRLGASWPLAWTHCSSEA